MKLQLLQGPQVQSSTPPLPIKPAPLFTASLCNFRLLCLLPPGTAHISSAAESESHKLFPLILPSASCLLLCWWVCSPGPWLQRSPHSLLVWPPPLPRTQSPHLAWIAAPPLEDLPQLLHPGPEPRDPSCLSLGPHCPGTFRSSVLSVLFPPGMALLLHLLQPGVLFILLGLRERTFLP